VLTTVAAKRRRLDWVNRVALAARKLLLIFP